MTVRPVRQFVNQNKRFEKTTEKQKGNYKRKTCNLEISRKMGEKRGGREQTRGEQKPLRRQREKDQKGEKGGKREKKGQK